MRRAQPPRLPRAHVSPWCDIGDGTGGVAHMGDGHDLCAFGDYLICGVGKDSSFIVQIKPFSVAPVRAASSWNGSNTE